MFITRVNAASWLSSSWASSEPLLLSEISLWLWAQGWRRLTTPFLISNLSFPCRYKRTTEGVLLYATLHTLLGSSHFLLSMAFACLKSGRLYGQSSTSPHVRVFVLLLAVLKHDTNPEAEFLNEIQTKVFRVYLLAIHSHLYNLQLCLEIYISSNSLNLLNISSNFKPFYVFYVQFSYCTL